MTSSHSIKFILAAIALSLNACQTDEIHALGDACPNLQIIYNGDRECFASDPSACLSPTDAIKASDYEAAFKYARCPVGFICAPEAQHSICQKVHCINDTDENGACLCAEECKNGCEPNGACKCASTCTNGCNDTGEKCCPDNCQNGCNASGGCLCPKGTDGKSCPNGCDTSGRACCDLKCQNGCNVDETCTCPVSCKFGCNDNGTCQSNPIGCAHGYDQNSGNCLCPDTCPDNCDPKGETCNCPSACPTSCNATGTECLCLTPCVATSSCDPRTGKCTCPTTCPNQCHEDGSCDDKCFDVQCDGENEQCQDGICVDLCKTTTCPEEQFCNLGRCVNIDANHNHMHDKYETAPKQGHACREYADCDSAAGKGDGFCDSFIGYKCSTKCTSDAQCTDLNGDGYHYVCRTDGRCAPDKFISVWRMTSSKYLDINLYANTDQIFTIDWGDGSTQTYKNEISVNSDKTFSHSYETTGEVTISITNITGDLRFGSSKPISDYDYYDEDYGYISSKQNLLEIKTFGPLGIGTRAFQKCSKLSKVSQVDIPRSDLLTTASNLFSETSEFNQDIGNWDTSNAT
ncbi:MAG: hypothetical protein IJ268_14280, partial [Proteobacteria bacterium]|nr:hypothetical protein [Pseudomonadota bacterium]